LGNIYLKNSDMTNTNYSTLHLLINLRGNWEQAFKFAFGFKGGMKQCYAIGCEIFTPLAFSLKNVDLSSAILMDRIMNEE
jgi:hypothetical protein